MHYLGICIFPKNFQTNCGVHLDIKQRFQVFLFGLLSCLIVPPLHHGYALTLQGCSWAHGGLGFHFWLCDPGKVQHRPEVLASGFVAETLRPQGFVSVVWLCVVCLFAWISKGSIEIFCMQSPTVPGWDCRVIFFFF